MNRRQNYILCSMISILLFCFFASLVPYCSQTLSPEPEPSLRFLPSYGSVNYVDGQPCTLTFSYLTQGKYDSIDPNSFVLNSPYVCAKDTKIKQETRYGRLTLWRLETTLALSSEATKEEMISLSSLSLNGSLFTSSLDLRVFPFPSDALQDPSILLHSEGFSLSSPVLNDYVSCFENSSSSPIFLTSIEIPGFPESETTVHLLTPESDMRQHYHRVSTQLSAGPIRIIPSESVDVEAELSPYAIPKVYDYRISPILHYEENGIDKRYPMLGYGTIATPSDTELRAIWEDLA